VVLVFRQSEGGLASRLPEAVRQQLCPQQALPLYVPEHDAAQRILQQAPVPVLLQGDRDNEPASLEQLCSAVGPDVALAIDAGTMPTGAPVSVVEVDGNRWQMLAEGAVSAEEIARQAPCLIVFVCTGNTCRSPIAEALCKKELAQRLGCPIEELPHRGYLVLSAGMAAAPGDMATPEAVEAARELGADLTGHLSRPLDPALVAQADYLLTMTRGHLALLAARHPEAGCRPRLLSPEGDDVPDPIGGEQAVYQDCARTIQKHVDALLREVLP
jgi:protein-tyrosine phosphatase